MESILMLSDSEDSSDSSESENDDDLIIACITLATCRRPNASLENNVVPRYSENHFINQFRIGTGRFLELQNQFEQHEVYKNLLTHSGGRRPLSPEKHILTFLYFVGHDATSFRTVNNMFDMSLSTLHSVVTRVAQFICSLGPEIIKWPTGDALEASKTYFHNRTKFPNVIGLIASNHVVIDKPLIDPESYLNLNGQYSIQVQGIVNHEKKFTDIFIGYPGSVDEACVFENSSIYSHLKECYQGYLLGNNGYPLRKNIITPYNDTGQLTAEQRHFNTVHSAARTHGQDSFTLLKQRFRRLYHLKLRKPALIVQIIKACCVLHNLADTEDINAMENVMETLDDNIITENAQYADTMDGKLAREELTTLLWNNH